MSVDVAALNAIAKAMVAPNKGLLAADESTGTIQKRFDAINVENVEANRQAYRDLLFHTKVGILPCTHTWPSSLCPRTLPPTSLE